MSNLIGALWMATWPLTTGHGIRRMSLISDCFIPLLSIQGRPIQSTSICLFQFINNRPFTWKKTWYLRYDNHDRPLTLTENNSSLPLLNKYTKIYGIHVPELVTCRFIDLATFDIQFSSSSRKSGIDWRKNQFKTAMEHYTLLFFSSDANDDNDTRTHLFLYV